MSAFESVVVSNCWVSVEGPDVGLAAGDYATGPEWLTPERARELAEALTAAADYVEANR